MNFGNCMKYKCEQCKYYINCFKYKRGSRWNTSKHMQKNSINQNNGKDVENHLSQRSRTKRVQDVKREKER